MSCRLKLSCNVCSLQCQFTVLHQNTQTFCAFKTFANLTLLKSQTLHCLHLCLLNNYNGLKLNWDTLDLTKLHEGP